MRFSPLSSSVPESTSLWVLLVTTRFLITSLLTSSLTLKTAYAHDLPSDWVMLKQDCFSSETFEFRSSSAAEQGQTVSQELSTRDFDESDEEREAWRQSIVAWSHSAAENLDAACKQSSANLRRYMQLRVADANAATAQASKRVLDSAIQGYGYYAQVHSGVIHWFGEGDRPAEPRERITESPRIAAEIESETDLRAIFCTTKANVDLLPIDVYALLQQDVLRHIADLPQDLRAWKLSAFQACGQLIDELFRSPSKNPLPYFTSPQFVRLDVEDGNRLILTREQAITWEWAQAGVLSYAADSEAVTRSAFDLRRAPCLAR